MKSARPTLSVKQLSFRKMKSVDTDKSREDICNSTLCQKTPDYLGTLATCYNKVLCSTLDKHAPVQSRSITIRPRVAWFSEEIKFAQRQRRQAVQRKWRCTKLHSDLASFKAKRNHVTFLMNKARQDYYQQFVEEHTDRSEKAVQG